MKKITLLLSFVACVVFANAQELIVNPGFETWTNGTSPDNWTFDKTTATLSKETTIVKNGTTSLKVVSTGTYWVTQYIPVTAGKTYTLSLNYYIGGGDGTDFRIWSNFCNISGSTYTFSPMSSADSLALKGPGGNTTTAYFPNVTGSWQSYTYNVTAPAGYSYFQFQVRTYTGSTVYLDDFSFSEKITGLSTPSAEALNVKVAGKTLTVTNSLSSSVEIFNTVGAKVQSLQLVNGSADLNLGKGLYIVRVGNKSAKIML
jgi:hypothetical protein